jgi:hypothetical protein
MDAITLVDARRPIVHPERDRHDERSLGVAKDLVNPGIEAHDLGCLVQLGERGFPRGVLARAEALVIYVGRH